MINPRFRFASSRLLAGRVKDDVGIGVFIASTIWLTRFKHAVDDADMKMHMRVKTGTKTMDESARTEVNIAFIDTGCAGSVLMQVGVEVRLCLTSR